jgi:hypothetical protein
MNRVIVVVGMFLCVCGIAAAGRVTQPGFSNTGLTVVVYVSAAAGHSWQFPDRAPGAVASALLWRLNEDGLDDNLDFDEANGETPQFRIDVTVTNDNEGTTRYKLDASVSGLGRGYLFNASSGDEPFTSADDAVASLADNLYGWFINGWNYTEPDVEYSPSYSNYGGSRSSDWGERIGLGLTLGRGAGLGAAYAWLRPTEVLGIELDYGVQPFVITGGAEPDTFWPKMVSAKLQIYGDHRRASTQFGVEAAADWAEHAGWSAHGAAIMQFRLGSHFDIDTNLGLGYLLDPNPKKVALTYALKNGLGYVPNESDMNLGFIGPLPLVLIGGIGLSFCF